MGGILKKHNLLKMCISKLLLIVMVGAMLPILNAAMATTYYIDPSGNDKNPGTSALPWQTIQKCTNAALGGDVCIAREGIYSGDINLSKSGTPGKILYVKSDIFQKAVITGMFNVSGNYITVDGFKVIMRDGYRGGISVSGSYNNIVKCFVTTESNVLGLNNTAIGAAGSNNVLDGNYVEKTCFGYYVDGASNTFKNNEASKLRRNGSCGDIDYMRFFGSGHQIINNRFYGIDLANVGSAHVDCFQTFDNGGPQYAISNIVLDGNYCSDAHEGMMLEGKIYKKSSGLVIKNNVFVRCGAWCVCLVDIADVHFLNNTCDTTGGLHGMWCRGFANISTCEFKNNIIYGTGTFYGVMETAKTIDGSINAPGKNNLLYRNGTVLTGNSEDLLNRDPLFVDRPSGNYRLQLASPAIDAGFSIPSVSVDLDGNSRPKGNGWDIGAYEYGSAIQQPKNLRKIQ
jgi:hypothetical protein